MSTASTEKSISSDKSLADNDISMSSTTAIGKPAGDKVDDDKTPLIENKKSSRLNLALWNAPIIAGFVSFKKILGVHFCKAIYILFILTIVFMLAQIAMWLLGATSESMQNDQQWGDRKGTGPAYDFLAGPVFAIMSIISTLPVGYIVDRKMIGRESFLLISCIIWSCSTVGTGLSQQYWQVVVCRMISAMSTSTAQPLCASIIADWYPSQIRASAMAVFNFGIYIGFSIVYGIGNYVSERFTWRLAWYIFGGCGIVFAVFIMLLPKYKSIQSFKKVTNVSMDNQNEANIDIEIDNISTDIAVIYGSDGSTFSSEFDKDKENIEEDGMVSIPEVIAYYLHSPSLVILLIASLYRNTGGYVWGYSVNNYFKNEKGQTENEIAQWLGWIPAVFGSLGCLFGGALSDRLATKYGRGANSTQFIESTVIIRIWVLVVASLISGPLAAGVLILDPPYGYYSMCLMYLFSEMWISITVAVIIDLSPQHMKSTLLSIYYFVIAFAGFTPSLISPIQHWTGSYFWAIFILWPFVYGSVAILFFLVIFTYKRDLRKQRRYSIRL